MGFKIKKKKNYAEKKIIDTHLPGHNYFNKRILKGCSGVFHKFFIHIFCETHLYNPLKLFCSICFTINQYRFP